MARKKFSEREVIETLAWQGVFVTCFRCGKPFLTVPANGKLIWVRNPEREHIHEIALGGADAPFNCRFSCDGCHKIQTNGTKATSVGSSKQRIAKVRRLSGQNKPKMKRAWPKRTFRREKPHV